MNKENLKRAQEIVDGIDYLERVIGHLELCSKESKNEAIEIKLLSANLSSKVINEFVPQLLPVITIIAKGNVLNKIKQLEIELETL